MSGSAVQAAPLEFEPETVLVVDDEQDILDLVRFRLEYDGYRVLTASDGQKGLTLARAERPDLCILDVMMPKLSGLEVLAHLRADPDTADTRVILLTSRGQDADVDRGFELGANDYVTKPFSPKELRRRVQAQLSR
jgi:two-component system, OmpR family, response regulator MtrA